MGTAQKPGLSLLCLFSFTPSHHHHPTPQQTSSSSTTSCLLCPFLHPGLFPFRSSLRSDRWCRSSTSKPQLPELSIRFARILGAGYQLAPYPREAKDRETEGYTLGYGNWGAPRFESLEIFQDRDGGNWRAVTQTRARSSSRLIKNGVAELNCKLLVTLPSQGLDLACRHRESQSYSISKRPQLREKEGRSKCQTCPTPSGSRIDDEKTISSRAGVVMRCRRQGKLRDTGINENATFAI